MLFVQSGLGESTRPQVQLTHVDFPGLLFTIQFEGREVFLFRCEQWGVSPWKSATTPSARLLRRVPFGELVADAREMLIRRAQKMPDLPQLQRVHDLAAALAERPGRRGRQDIEYARIAREYVARLDEPAPVRALSEALFLSEQRTRNVLMEARQRGLLTTPPKGRAGGKLTAKAKAILKEAEDGAR